MDEADIFLFLEGPKMVQKVRNTAGNLFIIFMFFLTCLPCYMVQGENMPVEARFGDSCSLFHRQKHGAVAVLTKTRSVTATLCTTPNVSFISIFQPSNIENLASSVAPGYINLIWIELQRAFVTYNELGS